MEHRLKLEISAGAVLAVAGVALAGFIAWRAVKAARQVASAASQAAGEAAQAVNPLNPENVFYGGANAAGAAASGDPDWTLGGWLYEIFNEDPMAIMQRNEEQQSAARNTGGATGSW